MCGIAGIAHWDGRPIAHAALKRMAGALVHRGPDEEGFYRNEIARSGEAGAAAASGRSGAGGAAVGLAHRRLAIIDLTSGQQPLANEDDSVWIVFNGEIYNYPALYRELSIRGHRFRTRSDTEVIVHAYEEWGDDCPGRLHGMFAFCIWDQRRNRLFAARDRLGKKPLYYHATRTTFVFGSELKALLTLAEVPRRIDPTAVADYFSLLYVPEPKSIYRDMRRLPAGHCLVADATGVTVREYWDVTFGDGPRRRAADLEEELFHLLDEAVRDRLVAEVPLGAFLSGGVDSSGVVALMARHSSRPVITCSIGFDDPAHDESRFAAEVARLLATDHSEHRITSGFAAAVRRLPAMFDEPFADGSAIPTFFVCLMARRRVTVALSGDGGDESFGGYDKYVKERIERRVGRLVPAFLLRAVQRASVGSGAWPRKARTLTSQALRKPARAFYMSNCCVRDDELRALLAPSLAELIRDYDPAEQIIGHFQRPAVDDHLSRMLYTDIKTYLVGDILVKVDRASMASSLEVRAPLLDHRVVEFAARLPSRLKIGRFERKYLLKRALGRVLPAAVLARPKHGFSVPVGGWLRGELAPLMEEALGADPDLKHLLNVSHVRGLFDLHRSGGRDCGTLLWSVLSFALWHRELGRRSRERPSLAA
ncbi:MAG: asparagine synthase (glutamine-hydrolyzing) [Gammaproteobacteria bacterium]|nr:asparagine synthase (glutamine-hydrolyzing) [Gammaproteobacteria bacterium]